MDLDVLREHIQFFEEKAGFSNTSKKKLVNMLKEDVLLLEANLDTNDVVNHQLSDILVLTLQIGKRSKTDFDAEIKKWFEKSEKYVNKK